MSAELSDYVFGVVRISTQINAEHDEMLILIDPVALLGG